jgi:hypothetical protein
MSYEDPESETIYPDEMKAWILHQCEEFTNGDLPFDRQDKLTDLGLDPYLPDKFLKEFFGDDRSESTL